ncbi:hypothetical protein PV11_07069 [Exophiala sideris]|uniref:Zn(2)-C6 fungal-type domain-containing protein n=1 Tax=Exophiala sideris TaxID=1016849 RepID=A0A0D1Y9F5_9EURO|nr:hypothetical protein PV11_07069 [Exophiala sideris]
MSARVSAPSERTSGPPRRETIPRGRSSHQGRVRTGCVTCRARKVKCDEQRPSCQRCAKSKRTCVYRRGPPPVPLKAVPDISNLDYPPNSNNPSKDPIVSLPAGTCTPGNSGPFSVGEDIAPPTEGVLASSDVASPSCNHHDAGSFHREPDLNRSESPSARFYNTSLDIYLVTTLDWLGASVLPQRSFSYFVEQVDCPLISPFDHSNWKWVKLHLTRLALKEMSVAAAILAVQNLYRVLVNGLPMSHAISEYHAAVTNLQVMVGNDTIEFETILAVAFLLCLCEITLPNVDGPPFGGFGQAFETRMEAWLTSLHVSPLSVRLCAWLQLLHVASKRVGNCGLMPEGVFTLLSNNITSVPTISMPDRYTDSADAMYDTISTPLFTFYLQLQRISNQVQGLSHYRRSRITPADQAEVADKAARLKRDMSALWDARPGPLRFRPGQVRGDFRPTIAEPVITLIGLCTAAYFVEVVALRRILGDPPFPSPESTSCLRQIREIVDGDWNVSSEGALNPGYGRPLFLYAIENLQGDETQWAAARLRQVKSPLSRSDFVASLVEALGEAQRTEQRRVTTKYFCNRTFNVPVPLI